MCAVVKEGWAAQHHANPPYAAAPMPGGKMPSAGQPQHRPAPYPMSHHQQQQHQQQQQFQQQLPRGYSYTPAASAAPPVKYQQPPVTGYFFHQPVEPVPTPGDCSRLNFSIRDGTVLAPFRLEHGLTVSRLQFELKPDVYRTLMSRADLELQLKAFLLEDQSGNCNWPSAVSVSVNGSPVPLTSQFRPAHVKHLLTQPGQPNMLQFTATNCCCSHMFVLQLVHRPTVASVVQSLWRKRRLALQSCVDKLQRLQLQQPQQATVSLRCPIGGGLRRVDLPARGCDCQHAQCFDLRAYLELNAETSAWRCPVCARPAMLEGLEIDEFIFGILEETRATVPHVDWVSLDRECKWRPLEPALKTEPRVPTPAARGSPAPGGPPPPTQNSKPPTPLSRGGSPANPPPPAAAAAAQALPPPPPPPPPRQLPAPISALAYPAPSAYQQAVYQQQQQQQQPGFPWSYQQQQQQSQPMQPQQQQSQQPPQSQPMQQPPQSQPPAQQQPQYSSSYPPTNSTNASSSSTTDPASIKTDLDDLTLDPLGCDAGAITDLLVLLDDSSGGDSLLGSIGL